MWVLCSRTTRSINSPTCSTLCRSGQKRITRVKWNEIPLFILICLNTVRVSFTAKGPAMGQWYLYTVRKNDAASLATMVLVPWCFAECTENVRISVGVPNGMLRRIIFLRDYSPVLKLYIYKRCIVQINTDFTVNGKRHI